MNIKNNIVAAAVLVVLLLPGISMAQTTTISDLQAQIQSLLVQLHSLQAQVRALSGINTNPLTELPTVGSSTSITPSSTAWCHSFPKNLWMGERGDAVSALQSALHDDGESVDVSGSFDASTASAVKGFQEKYSSDILQPNGLSNGTGYFGSATRAKINKLFGCDGDSAHVHPYPPVISSSTGTSTWPVLCFTDGDGKYHCNPSSVGTSTTSTLPVRVCPAWGCHGLEPVDPEYPINGSTTISTSTRIAPTLTSLTPASGTPGTIVTVTGSGFLPLNRVIFGSYVAGVASSSDGTTLTFRVPYRLYPYCTDGQACPQFIIAMAPGVYPVSVMNQAGTSNALSFTVVIPGVSSSTTTTLN